MQKYGGMSLDKMCVQRIFNSLPKGSTILELGSGWCTGELSKKYTMVSVENNIDYLNKYDSDYIHAPIKEKWYDLEEIDFDFDCLLIDGPHHRQGNRKKILDNLSKFGDLSEKMIVVDDTDRKDGRIIFEKLLEKTGKKGKTFQGETKEFGVINYNPSLLIAIPSKDRVDTFREKTLQVLGDHDFTLFVEPQEASDYAEWNPEVIPENDKGICYVMAYIKDYALKHGHDYVLKIDDDVEELDVNALIKEAEYLFDKYDNVGAVSCTRGKRDTWPYMFVDHPLESVFVIRTELMTDETDLYWHDAMQSLKIWSDDYRIVQTGINLSNNVGRFTDKKFYKKNLYEQKVDDFIPLQAGTENELKTILCKKS